MKLLFFSQNYDFYLILLRKTLDFYVHFGFSRSYDRNIINLINKIKNNLINKNRILLGINGPSACKIYSNALTRCRDINN